MIYIYDIECFTNYFCVTFKNVKDNQLHNFVIYHSYQNSNKQKNELEALWSFISKDKNKWLVGYNSKYFDNQILNYIFSNYNILSILNTEHLTKDIYDFMVTILNNNTTEYKYRLPFQSVDLMQVGNVQQKSLKLVAVNLNWPIIQDLPIKYDSEINDSQLDLIYNYNLNDVNITEQLYYKLFKDINVRWEVGQKYGIDLMSEPDSGMANRLLEKM